MALPGINRSITPPPLPPTTGPGGNTPVQPKKPEQGRPGGGNALTTDSQQPNTTTAPTQGKTTPELPATRINFSQFNDIISTVVNLLGGGVDIFKMGVGINTAVSRDFTTSPLTDAEKTKYALTNEERNAAVLDKAKKAEPNRDFAKTPLTDAEKTKYTLTETETTSAIQTKVTADSVKSTFTGLDTLFEKILGPGNSLTAYIQKNGGDVTLLIADIALSIATGKPLSPKSVGILVGAVGLLASELFKATGLDKEIQNILTNAGLTTTEAKSVTDFIMGASLLVASGALGGDMSQAMKVAGLDNTVLSLVTTLTKDGAFNLSPESLQKLLDKLDPNKPGNILPDLQNLINAVIVPIQNAVSSLTSTVQDSAPQEDLSGGAGA